MTTTSEFASLTTGTLQDELTDLVSAAAAAIMGIDRSELKQQEKDDRSPVTNADHAAEATILDGLAHLLPGVPVISEEATLENLPSQLGEVFILVDPLDGTREFVAGHPEFTVNIAVVVDGTPTMGFIAAPALSLVWRGIIGYGAERLDLAPGSDVRACHTVKSIRARPLDMQEIVALVSRSHLDQKTLEFLERFPRVRRIACGSSAKLCRVAEGSADLYPRLAPTSEWDVAAGHAIVVAAGGAVLRPDGEMLTYGRHDDQRVPSFVACGDPPAMRAILRGSRAARSLPSN